MAGPTIEDFIKHPQPMEKCCKLLRILYSNQVHREIIYAVSHLTALHKSKGQANDFNALRVRRESDPETFTPKFNGLIDEFLVKCKGGILFFPLLIPDRKGYSSSFAEDRLIWMSAKDQPLIRNGMALLVER